MTNEMLQANDSKTTDTNGDGGGRSAPEAGEDGGGGWTKRGELRRGNLTTGDRINRL